MSQVQFSGSSVFAFGALVFGGRALTKSAPAPKKAVKKTAKKSTKKSVALKESDDEEENDYDANLLN